MSRKTRLPAPVYWVHLERLVRRAWHGHTHTHARVHPDNRCKGIYTHKRTYVFTHAFRLHKPEQRHRRTIRQLCMRVRTHDHGLSTVRSAGGHTETCFRGSMVLPIVGSYDLSRREGAKCVLREPHRNTEAPVHLSR